MSRAAATAEANPGTARTTAAVTPVPIISQVTALGDQPRRANTHVPYGESRRMSNLPAQCSSLRRAVTDSGWPAARSSASDGPDILLHPLASRVRVKSEVLKNRVTPWPRGGRVGDGLGELRR